MNWLFFIEATFSGVFAGYATWLLTPAGNNWNILADFQSSLLSIGIFCGLFIGLFRCLSPALKERRLFKALQFFIIGSSIGLAISMLGSVIFTILASFALAKLPISIGTVRILWWTWLAACLSSCFGILQKSTKILFRAFIGLAPGLIIAGISIDKYFIPNEQYLAGIVFAGAISSISLAIAWEILKDAWLDEDLTLFIKYRFFLDTQDYLIGSSNSCDLCLSSGPEKLAIITEKNSMHTLEIFDTKQYVKINSHKFRCKILIDGDVITVGNKKLVYHTRYSRSQDAIPDALAG